MIDIYRGNNGDSAVFIYLFIYFLLIYMVYVTHFFFAHTTEYVS